jgi:sulfopropanediol 3-dehydrogenase
MARWLKQGAESAKVADQDRKVREVVKQTLAEIEARGDEAARELSIKETGWRHGG